MTGSIAYLWVKSLDLFKKRENKHCTTGPIQFADLHIGQAKTNFYQCVISSKSTDNTVSRMNMDYETLEWYRCVKKYRGPKIEHPSTHRTVLNGSVLFVKVVLSPCMSMEGDFLSWGTANVLTQVLQIHDLTKIKGDIKLELHILSWLTIRIGGKHAALLVPSSLHLRKHLGHPHTCVHTWVTRILAYDYRYQQTLVQCILLCTRILVRAFSYPQMLEYLVGLGKHALCMLTPVESYQVK